MPIERRWFCSLLLLCCFVQALKSSTNSYAQMRAVQNELVLTSEAGSSSTRLASCFSAHFICVASRWMTGDKTTTTTLPRWTSHRPTHGGGNASSPSSYRPRRSWRCAAFRGAVRTVHPPRHLENAGASRSCTGGSICLFTTIPKRSPPKTWSTNRTRSEEHSLNSSHSQ